MLLSVFERGCLFGILTPGLDNFTILPSPTTQRAAGRARHRSHETRLRDEQVLDQVEVGELELGAANLELVLNNNIVIIM